MKQRKMILISERGRLCWNEPLVKQIYIDDNEHTVDWLMYRSYEFNRLRSPEIAAERWSVIS